MFKKPVLLLSLSALLCLTACDEGLGVNITFKSKDKDTGSSQAVSSGDSVTINPPEKEIGNRIPKSFEGVWVSLRDAPITEFDAAEICDGSYENNYQERSWIKEIDIQKQQIVDIFHYEDTVTYTPLSYRINTPNAIAGKAKSESYEIAPDGPVTTKFEDFSYELSGGRLYSMEKTGNGKKAVGFIKCTNH